MNAPPPFRSRRRCRPPVLRVGVIGGGLVAQLMHLPNLARMGDRFRIEALADPSALVREALAHRHAIPHTYADHRDLLGAGVIDAVIVCSPNATHAEVVLDALEAGVHVLVEKPLCITLDDADRIVAAARRQAVVQVGYMKRFDPAVERLIEELPDDVTDLRYVDVVTYDPRLARHFASVAGPDVPEDVRQRLVEAEREQVEAAVGIQPTAAARCFIDVYLGALVHDVNLVHAMLARMGEAVPARVRAGGVRLDGSAAAAHLQLSSGVRWSVAWLLLDGVEEFAERLTLYFTDSVRSLDFPAPYLAQAPTTYACNRGDGGRQVATATRSHREPFVTQLEHFYDCVVHDAVRRNPPEEARVDIAALTDMFVAADHAAAGTAGSPVLA